MERMQPSDHAVFERVRGALLQLPRVAETMQWGGNLVFWTLDKAVGGKMFAVIDLDELDGPVLSFAAGPRRGPELLECEGVRPAPYLARAHWVALQHWQVLPLAQLMQELRSAYEYVGSRMPMRVQRVYELSQREYRALVREQRAAS